MSSQALISIHPDHIANIATGAKTVELRRSNLQLRIGQILWLYATSPICAIQFATTVNAVHRLESEKIWQKFGARICIDRSAFDDYVDDRLCMTAIELGPVWSLPKSHSLSELRKVSMRFHPPQQAIYLHPESSILKKLMRTLPDSMKIQ